jgi:hypothetical protein
MVELTSTSASNGTRNWYLYWHICISSVDVFIIDFGTRQRSYFAECPAPNTQQRMLCRVLLLNTWQNIYIFFLFFQLIFLWYVPTLCRPTCSIFFTIINVFVITIIFNSFNWISSKNSDLNCKSLEIWKSVHAKMIFMLFSTSYANNEFFPRRPRPHDAPAQRHGCPRPRLPRRWHGGKTVTSL